MRMAASWLFTQNGSTECKVAARSSRLIASSPQIRSSLNHKEPYT